MKSNSTASQSGSSGSALEPAANEALPQGSGITGGVGRADQAVRAWAEPRVRGKYRPAVYGGYSITKTTAARLRANCDDGHHAVFALDYVNDQGP